MAYIRKTHDEFEIQGFYYGEWSCETTELSFADAKKTIETYRENCPGTLFRIVKRRVPNTRQ